MPSPRSILPLLAAAAAVALPATAEADGAPVSSVAFDSSGALVWTGSDAQNFMSAYDNGDGTIVLADAGSGSITTTDAHCHAGPMSYQATCDAPTAIKVTMGGARDLWQGS